MKDTITVKVDDLNKVSDGYHTIQELYDHRCILFACLISRVKYSTWKSKIHDDGTMLDGWFIAGIQTPDGPATYHLPMHLWDRIKTDQELEKVPSFDGHTPKDVIERLKSIIEGE